MSDENVSILDQIINKKKADEIINLDAVEIINNLFTELTERERDVLIRRHGLHTGVKETLESIGNAHQLTRERIRQIESSSIKKLQDLNNLKEYIQALKNVTYQLLEEHGDMMEKEYLLELLVGFSMDGSNDKQHDKQVHKNYLNFMITKLLHDEFEELNNSKHFKDSYRVKFKKITHLEELAEELLIKIKEPKKILSTEKLFDLIFSLEKYKEHKERIKQDYNLDISRFIKHEHYDENTNLINENKTVYSLLNAHKRIGQNKFGYWGVHNWREIKPRTINDKIYLILKNKGKPMHFAKISEFINTIGFDHRKANPATVHNELILDKKYVLVGRGMYALKEWGYNKGTVVDVITEILQGADEALHRDDIIEEVLKRRMVKKATIILALMNKDKFAREKGKYLINI